jgi:hypothetical protein
MSVSKSKSNLKTKVAARTSTKTKTNTNTNTSMSAKKTTEAEECQKVPPLADDGAPLEWVCVPCNFRTRSSSNFKNHQYTMRHYKAVKKKEQEDSASQKEDKCPDQEVQKKQCVPVEDEGLNVMTGAGVVGNKSSLADLDVDLVGLGLSVSVDDLVGTSLRNKPKKLVVEPPSEVVTESSPPSSGSGRDMKHMFGVEYDLDSVSVPYHDYRKESDELVAKSLLYGAGLWVVIGAGMYAAGLLTGVYVGGTWGGCVV